MEKERYTEALQTIAQWCNEHFKDGCNLEIKRNKEGEIVIYQVDKKILARVKPQIATN